MKDFEKNSIIIFTLTMICSVINYLFQIIMGRMLDIESFGILNAISAFYLIISIPTIVIFMLVSKYVSEYKALNAPIDILIKKIFILVLLISVVFSIIGICLSCYIKTLINIDNINLLYITILAVGFGYILQIALGGLQGGKKFIAFGIICLAQSLNKLFGSIIFLKLGFELNGVVFSFLIGNILAIIIGFCILKIDFKVTINKITIKNKKNVVQFAWAALLYNIGTNVLTNIDIIIVKKYFSEEITGLYSAASILGKIIIFASSTIILVLFPYAAEANVKNENKNKLLIKSLIYGGCLSVIFALGINIFSKYIISFLFGYRYIESIEYLLYISIWIVFLSLLIIISNYLLAINRVKLISYSMVSGCIISIILILLFNNNNILRIIFILIVISFSILIINIISLIINNYKKDMN